MVGKTNVMGCCSLAVAIFEAAGGVADPDSSERF